MFGSFAYGGAPYGGRRGFLSTPTETTIVSGTPSVILSNVTEMVTMIRRPDGAILRTRTERIVLTTQREDIIPPGGQDEDVLLL